jgi:hypothetical protein
MNGHDTDNSEHYVDAAAESALLLRVQQRQEAVAQAQAAQIPRYTDAELLTELSRETFAPSWEDIRIKRTYGEHTRYFRLPIQAVDIGYLQRKLTELGDDEKALIIAAAREQYGPDATEQNILLTLGSICLGLRAPMTLRSGDTVVWVADGQPQHFAEALLALLDLHLDTIEADQIATRVLQMNHDAAREQGERLGNS